MRWKQIVASSVLMAALDLGSHAHAQSSDLIQPFAGPARGVDDLLDGNSRNPFDQSEAGEARRAGQILPMWEVIHRLGPELRGQVVATDITRRSGRWLYEFQVLRADGRLVRVWADAATGELVGSGR
jgi:uncharacterized membrane protein YkoI